MARAAHIASIVASLVTIIAFVTGIWQFYETQKLSQENLKMQAEALKNEQETKAVELFLKFNELQKEIVMKPLPLEGGASFWHYNALLGLTESIYNLTNENSIWEETIQWMLKTQEPFLIQEKINCGTYTPAFVEQMKKPRQCFAVTKLIRVFKFVVQP